MANPFFIVIPARYASSRFPGKPLVKLCGKAMLSHVYDRALGSESADNVIATDDERIADYCEEYKLSYLMTSADHTNGTDRIAEVARVKGWDKDAVVVGLQGDEPATPPAIINQVARNLHEHSAAHIATLCSAINQREDYLDPNRVKVVRDENAMALYFSRAPIPWRRDSEAGKEHEFPAAYVHIGMYAYRVGFLHDYSNLSETAYEREEKLEQLRALGHGYRIHVDIAEALPSHGVDHPNDVQVAEKALKALLN